MRRCLLTLLCLAVLCGTASAQTTRARLLQDLPRTAGAYWAYPGPSQEKLTPPPAGYEPFYISHYGRHGSRYLGENDAYELALSMLDSAGRAGKLTPLGRDVLEKLRVCYADALHREGELSVLGGEQHRGIARRMYERFPELLSLPMKVDARSSTAGRCMMSMAFFCQELKGLNPSLEIGLRASEREMPFVVGDNEMALPAGPAADSLQKVVADMRRAAFDATRLTGTLFDGFDTGEDGPSLMYALHTVAADLQNVPELGISLLDLFTPDELFAIWNANNAFWVRYVGMAPGATPRYLRQVPVRDSIVRAADQVIRSGEPALTLRFSHDSSVATLAYLMGLEETQGQVTTLENAYESVSIDRLVPMACNIQLVFYRREGSDDILVKFLYNENETTIPVKTDVSPYYHWTDVRRFWKMK
jgi:hypothetical protein